MILCSRVEVQQYEEHSTAIISGSYHVILHFHQGGLCAVVAVVCRLVHLMEFVCFHITGELHSSDLLHDLGGKRQVRDWPIAADYLQVK